jgi:hypothetical protein
MLTKTPTVDRAKKMRERARAIRMAGTPIAAAVASGALPRVFDVSLSEALVLGLLNQGVTKYLAIFWPRLDRLGRSSADLRRGRRYANLQLPQ